MTTYTELTYKPFFFVFILQITLTLTFGNQVKFISQITLSYLNLLRWADLQSYFTSDIVFDTLIATEHNTSFESKRKYKSLNFFLKRWTDV